MREDLRTTTEKFQTLTSENPEVAKANNAEDLTYEAFELAQPTEKIVVSKLPPRMGEVAHGAVVQQPNPERPLTAAEVIGEYTKNVMGLRQKYRASFESGDNQSNYGLAA